MEKRGINYITILTPKSVAPLCWRCAHDHIYVPLSIILNHWLLVFITSPTFFLSFSSNMVAIRRAPAPPHLSPQDSDSSSTATPPSRTKASRHDSPGRPSRQTTAKSRDEPPAGHRADDSHDTVSHV